MKQPSRDPMGALTPPSARQTPVRGRRPFVATCALCGTAYTAVGWSWLDVLGLQHGDEEALELRRCALSKCCNTLALPQGPGSTDEA